MYIKPIIVIALIISAALMAAKFSPGIKDTEQFREGKYIHIDSIKIVFDKTDANVDMQYHLSPFAEAYMLLFGSKNLEPKIRTIFANFPEVKVLQIENNRAALHITNISRQKDENYLQDSRELGMSTDSLTLVSPQGTRSLQNQNSTGNFFYWY